MRKFQKSLVAVTLLSLLSFANSESMALTIEQPKVVVPNVSEEVIENAATANLPVQQLLLFVNVFEQLRANYVEEVTEETLVNNAIKGMLSGLDPHSEFYDSESYKKVQEFTTGSFAGLGVEVVSEDGLIRIISPMDGSPAKKAGIQAGDLIIKIDSTAVQSIDVAKAVDMLKGEPGTEVVLTIIRESERSPLTIPVVRDVIKTESIKGELIDNEFGYIRLSQFQERSAEEMKTAIDDLNKQAMAKKTTVKGLILDLRNNPGGVLDQAVEISDLFLESGLIVYTQGRDPASRIDFVANPGDILEGAPLVVLINGGSASASEIVAGAIQDQRRGIIAGEKSFGKGSVQSVVNLANGQGMKYTTALYYTPEGRSIQGEGISPNIELLSLNVDSERNSNFIREENLAKRLNKGSDKEQNITTFAQSEKARGLAISDNQLYEALNLLKSLIFVKDVLETQ
ncbi:S41 family peptidase [Wohlfahrtiimonas larvae]|uniref:S41 family peptidase n=1 Tax=Wohlfahrtiimonas larvae TaxID=1157986 RepID=A0ABP9MJC1_9GAMM|nr:S41 family peptidase [Wohlfahrtiimonas larvae]